MTPLQASFAFDIETIPIMDLVEADLPKREEFVDAPMPNFAEFKKPETRDRKRVEWVSATNERIRKWEERQNKVRQDAIDKATLDASQAKILCMSYADSKGSWVEWGDESDLLENLWDLCCITQLNAGRVFSASSSQFDIRFAWRRSLALGVELPVSLRLVEFRGARAFLADSFIDCCEVWAAGDYGKRISVNRLARAFGVEGKAESDEVSGANFWRVYVDGGSRDLLEAYAKRDAEIAWEVGLKMAKSGIFKLDLTEPLDPVIEDADVIVFDQSPG